MQNYSFFRTAKLQIYMSFSYISGFTDFFFRNFVAQACSASPRPHQYPTSYVGTWCTVVCCELVMHGVSTGVAAQVWGVELGRRSYYTCALAD